MLFVFSEFLPFFEQLILCLLAIVIEYDAIAYRANLGAFGRIGVLNTLSTPVGIDYEDDIALCVEIAIHSYANVTVLTFLRIGDSALVNRIVRITYRLASTASGAFIIIDSKRHIILVVFAF